MCGFAGFTGDIENKEKVINNMLNKIIHRGPDSDGLFTDDITTLGFRRLSIIDLEGSSQPIYNEDSSKVIVFNGEIYNYKQLRAQLIEKGHIFKTDGDTETLIHLYEEYGKAMTNHLRGMFAFVIYDKVEKSLFAVRDFFGIKPFYYTMCDEHLLFGSELKSFFEFPNMKKEFNYDAFENYLSFQYSPLEETFFKGVYKLMPGHSLFFKDGKIEINKYFDVKFEEQQQTLEESVQKIDDVILNSVKAHKISDVEVGSFLSSGVDSSYVASTFKGDKTFTVGFDINGYSEIDYAKALSEKVGIKNYNKIISKKEYFDILPKIQYFMDEPLADPAAVALYFVSNVASQHVKVSMSGEGADEFFGGYNIYKEPIDIKILTNLPMPIRRFLGKIGTMLPKGMKGKSLLIRASQTIEERFIGNAKMFLEDEKNIILKERKSNIKPIDITKKYYDKVKGHDDITKMQYLDIHMWMASDILLKADKMSMANSLEVRVPFLDKEVFDIARKLPLNHRVTKQATKFAFRQAANKHVPKDVADKKKLGFPVPIRVWLREEETFNKVKTTLTSESSSKFFNTNELVKLLEEHRAEKVDNSRKIWTIYMFLLWYEQYFVN